MEYFINSIVGTSHSGQATLLIGGVYIHILVLCPIVLQVARKIAPYDGAFNFYACYQVYFPGIDTPGDFKNKYLEAIV